MRFAVFAFLFAQIVVADTACAGEWTISTNTQYVLQNSGSSPSRSLWNRIRFDWEQEFYDSCLAEISYELMPIWMEHAGLHQNTVSMKNKTTRIYRLSNLPVRLFGNDDSSTDARTMLEQNLDRAYVSCRAGNWDFQLGRQAVSFGASHSVSPTDVFAPVSFKKMDGEFRPGVDAARAMAWISDTAELELGALSGFEEKPGNNGAYLRLHFLSGMLDLAPMLAVFGKSQLAGLSIQTSAGPFGLTFDGAWVRLGEAHNSERILQDIKTEWLPWTTGINQQLSADLFVSLDYHFNAMGAKNPEAYLTNSASGIYSNYPVTLFGRDYLMPLLQYQLHPLLFFNLSLWGNLNDGSYLASPLLEWNIQEDWWLSCSGSRGYGKPAGSPLSMQSEFGDVPGSIRLIVRHYR